tara:strand:+ start:10464 stop:11168 length:705 start_codon:yes stop_codon:yes gene_type:complete
MPTYNVSVQNQNYSVVSEAQKRYAVGVNYDIPAKYLQNNNVVLDTINTGFNGVATTFNLTQDGVAYTPTNDAQLIVSINGQIQHPGIDYSVSGDQITFATAPDLGDPAFIVATSTTADLTRTINFVYGSGSVDMNNGPKGELAIDVTGKLQSWTLTTDVVGIITLDVQKCTFNDYPNFQTICGSDKPQISGNLKNSSDNLSAWDVDIIAGEMLRFRVDQVNQIRRFMLSLKLFL